MTRILLPLVLVASSILNPPSARAESQWILVSDIHASLEHLEGFMVIAAEEGERFRQRYPQGELFSFFNGDIVGIGPWSEIYGDEILDMIVAMAPKRRFYGVAGNHEHFDVNGGGSQSGNALFIQHITAFQNRYESKTGERPYLLNASIELTDVGRRIFRPSVDVRTNSGVIRIFGMVLDEYFKKSLYSSDTSSEQVFSNSSVRNQFDVAHRELTKAQVDGVDAVLIASHDYYGKVLSLKRELNRYPWRNQVSGKRIELPWAFAAHDHEAQANIEIGVADGGANFEAAVVEIGPGFERSQVKLISTVELEAARSRFDSSKHLMTPDELEFLERVRPSIEKRRTFLYQPVFPHDSVAKHRVENKGETKRRPTFAGTAAASAMYLAAKRQLLELAQEPSYQAKLLSKDGKLIPLIAFHHSSSYRNDIVIEAGSPIRNLDIFSNYPFDGRSQTALMTGRQATEIYWSLRKDRLEKDGTHTPQLSANAESSYKNVAGLQQTGLRLLDDLHKMTDLSEDAVVAVVLDPVTSKNMQGSQTLARIFTQVEWLPDTLPEQKLLMRDRFAQFVVSPKSCRETLIEKTKMIDSDR